MNKTLKLFKNLSLYVIGAFLTQGIRFLASLIFARLMSTTEYAYFNSYETWISIISIIIGMQTSASIANAFIKFEKDELKSYYTSLTLVGLISFLAVSIVFLFLSNELAELFEITTIALGIGVIQCLFMFSHNILLERFRINEQPVKYLILSLANAVLNVSISLVLILIIENNKHLGRVYGSSVSYALCGLFAFAVIFKQSRSIKWKYIKFALILSVPLIFHSLASVILAKSDFMMVMKMISEDSAGQYSYGVNIAHILNVLFLACNTAYIPWYYKKLKALEQKTGSFSDINSVIKTYIFEFSFVCCGFAMILPEAIKLLGGGQYDEAIIPSIVISFGVFLNFLYTFYANYEFYNKKTIFIAIGTIISAGLNVLFNFLLIPVLGTVGAALATAASYLILLFAHYFVTRFVLKGYHLNIIYIILPLLFVGSTLAISIILINVLWARFLILAIMIILFVFVGINFLKNNKNRSEPEEANND